ncbi:hypothetical protein FACS1894187_01530 [Synergistales bacterium]|nr:hypothetical protein FACS1894187_01530 [Synergistales bacterium]
MSAQMLRHTLDVLKQEKFLLECDREVDYVYEMGAVLKHFDNKRPILFNKVKNGVMRTAGGLYGDREILYKLLGVSKENRNARFLNALTRPMPYEILSSGPVKENVAKRNVDLMRLLPVSKFQEKDASNFITAGVLVLKDPETGRFFTSIRRMQVQKGNVLSVLIASPKLTNDFLEVEKQDKPLEVAVVFGYDAPFLMASQYPSATYGVDKYELDSALRGEPLQLVRCETKDLLVPAQAEVVLEGVMVPGKRELEGPFGELMGYYGGQAQHPIVEIDALTYRNDPIYQTAFPCREEHLSNGLIREMELFYFLKNQVDVVDVNVTEGGGYRFNAVVSVRKGKLGTGKTVILASLGLNKDLKQVVVVDDDVDIYDPRDIEWAITTRTQAAKDFVIVPGALGSTLDPSHGLRGMTDKLGIDATKDPERTELFERAAIPGFEKIDISKYFSNTTL